MHAGEAVWALVIAGWEYMDVRGMRGGDQRDGAKGDAEDCREGEEHGFHRRSSWLRALRWILLIGGMV
jgi:hypothetical protein